MKRDPADTRALMVLQTEARRVTESAERVRLVVQAMALRHGLRDIPPTEVGDEFIDGV